jgi:hypothetical protein
MEELGQIYITSLPIELMSIRKILTNDIVIIIVQAT